MRSQSERPLPRCPAFSARPPQTPASGLAQPHASTGVSRGCSSFHRAPESGRQQGTGTLGVRGTGTFRFTTVFVPNGPQVTSVLKNLSAATKGPSYFTHYTLLDLGPLALKSILFLKLESASQWKSLSVINPQVT